METRHKRPGRPKTARAFTLIELLIVVLIIAILAAIAVPNFLEFQTRAKVARVKAEFRALATALEAYYVDHNQYAFYDNPAMGFPTRYHEISYHLIELTSPIAYISTVNFRDPFLAGESDRGYGDGVVRSHYNYRSHEVWTGSHAYDTITVWVLNSIGPDNVANKGLMTEMWARGLFTHVKFAIYDPTNGTISAGDIPRTGGDTRYHNN